MEQGEHPAVAGRPPERPPERPPVEAPHPPLKTVRQERPPTNREPPKPAPPRVVEKDEGLLSGPRRLTNRAFDALDEMGEWVLGRRP